MDLAAPHDPKTVTYDQAAELIRRAKAQALECVLATGVFNVLHIGHTTFLKDARSNGNLLFVGLECDETVRLNKGSQRPLNPISERLQLMADLSCVSYTFALPLAAVYGPDGSPHYEQRLRNLSPIKLALSLNDPLFELRRDQAAKQGIGIALSGGTWRAYSSTSLLSALNLL